MYKILYNILKISYLLYIFIHAWDNFIQQKKNNNLYDWIISISTRISVDRV